MKYFLTFVHPTWNNTHLTQSAYLASTDQMWAVLVKVGFGLISGYKTPFAL